MQRNATLNLVTKEHQEEERHARELATTWEGRAASKRFIVLVFGLGISLGGAAVHWFPKGIPQNSLLPVHRSVSFDQVDRP